MIQLSVDTALMAQAKPLECPACRAYVRMDWSDDCQKCGAVLVPPPPVVEEPEAAAAPIPAPAGFAAPTSKPLWQPASGPAPVFINNPEHVAVKFIAVGGLVALTVLPFVAVIAIGAATFLGGNIAQSREFQSNVSDSQSLTGDGTTSYSSDSGYTNY